MNDDVQNQFTTYYELIIIIMSVINLIISFLLK